jgi:hypothetical protein
METPNKPIIRLFDYTDLGLIILFPSGVLYSNQSGGYACLHPVEEGVFVPISIEIINLSDSLTMYFTGSKWRGWCAYGIDEQTADFIDQILQTTSGTNFLKVDRTKLSDSYEAWVYVDISEPNDQVPSIIGFGECKGVLTWLNSD